MPFVLIHQKKNHSYRFSLAPLLLWLAVLISFIACRKEQAGSNRFPYPKDSLESINRWILDSMDYYYLYSDGMKTPSGLSENPGDFFYGLLNPADPFSWISNGTDYKPAKSSFDSYGFQFIIIQLPAYSGTEMLGIITLVAPESPASRAGLERGDYFTKVNNSVINAQGMAGVLDAMKGGELLSLTMAENRDGTWNESGKKSVSAAYFEERPVYTTRLFSSSGKRAGYIFYNRFEEFFDKDVLDALTKLKKQHITDLIIDLRYNPGGNVSSAAKISASILKNIEPSATFAVFKGNSHIGRVTQSFKDAVGSSSNPYKKDINALQAESLGLERVFIISTTATASAAEMMINNLRPYMQVVQIGEKSLGKDKAGWIIRDLRQPIQIAWFMQPMIYSIFNAAEEGGYEHGLIPDYPVEEYGSLPLLPLGDLSDPLINKAIQLIFSGAPVNGQVLRKAAFTLSREAVHFNSAIERNKKINLVHLSNR